MSTEQNTAVVAKYIWKDLHPDTIRGYAETVYKESHRLPDKWEFLIGDEGLFDIPRDRYVHDVVKEYPHPNLYLREVEDNVIDAMDSWAISNQEGYLIWVSPSFDGHYPGHKVEIVHKIPGTRKTSNVIICFDGNQDVCMKAAEELFPELESLNNVEELRSSLVARESLNVEAVLKHLNPYIPKDKNLNPVPREVFDYIVELTLNGADQRFIAHEMQRLNVIGSFSFSCPGGGGLMSVLGENSLSLGKVSTEGWHNGTCVVCHSSTWVGPCNICKPCEAKL